jgi:hypothetical protein
LLGKRIRFALAAALAVSLVGASLAIAASQGQRKHEQGQFEATLTGHEETPAIHTAGQGHLALTINSNNTISFTLTYSNLTAPAAVAHVHFGQPGVAGGVSFFFCGGAKPACPAGNTASTATVTGTVTAADVLAIPAQGLAANDIGAIIQEIRDGFAYANVHTAPFPNGEIRGQIGEGNGNDNGNHNDNRGNGKGKGHDENDD